MTDPAARLDRRYPVHRNRLGDWRLWAVGLAVLGLAWLGWAASTGANPAVSGRVDGFEVLSTTDMRVELSVERQDPSRAAECFLFAQALSYERVGELTFRVEPGDTPLTRLEVTVRTFKRATAVTLESCRTVD